MEHTETTNDRRSPRVWTCWAGGAACGDLDLDRRYAPWSDALELEIVVVRGRSWAMWLLACTGALLWMEPAGKA